VPYQKSENIQQYFDVLLPIANEPGKLSDALRNSKQNLIRTAKEIGTLLSCEV
jgi:glycerate 2-kinase